MIPIGVLVVGLSAAVFVDVRSRRIPNWLTMSLAGIGLLIAAAGVSGVTATQAALGLGAGLLLMMPGYVLGATGAGDVKLMAAIGAVVGSPFVVQAFVGSAIAGGVLAVLVAVRRGQFRQTVEGTAQLVASPAVGKMIVESSGRSNRFAYGPAIAIGTLAAMLLR